MPVHIDQLNRRVDLPTTPARIISLVPSQTELLFDLGLDEEIAGVTKFCIHPIHKIKSKIKIGGTKQLNIPLIKSLNPDLIIANKEENDKSQIEELSALYPVWISDISNLEEAIEMINGIGQLVKREKEATVLINSVRSGFDTLNILTRPVRVAYLIWRNPYMAAGKQTFIANMLEKCGFQNAFDVERYPEVSADMLVKTNPEIIFLSSEPYPFKDKHIREFKELLPDATVKLVDGEMFSWYGSRLLQAPTYFKKVVQDIDL